MYDVKSSTSQHFCQLFCLLSLSFCSHILGVVKRNPLFLHEIEWNIIINIIINDTKMSEPTLQHVTYTLIPAPD